MKNPELPIMKFLKVFTVIVFSLIIAGCDEDSSNSVESVNIQRLFKNIRLFPENISKHIESDSSFESADILLFTSIQSDSLKNNVLPDPETYTYAYAFADYPSKIAGLKFDSYVLDVNYDMISNVFYEYPEHWNSRKFDYSNTYGWEIKDRKGNIRTFETKFCTSLFPAGINTGDTLKRNSGFTISWNPSEDPDDELWLDFSLLKSDGSFSSYYGTKLDDNGSSEIENDALANYGINDKGLLIFRLLRLKKTEKITDLPGIDGNKVVNYTFTEAKFWVYYD